MSDNPISISIQQLKGLITSIMDYLVPNQNRPRTLASSIGRGSIWALALNGISILLTGLFVMLSDLSLSLSETLRLAVNLAVSAVGATPNFEMSIPELGLAPVGFQLGIRPSLLTLFLVLVAFRYGRKLVTSGNIKTGQSAAQSAWGAGLGFTLITLAASFLSAGSIGLNLTSSVSLVSIDIVDCGFAFLVVALSVWLGGLLAANRAGSRLGSGFIAWISNALKTFVKLYAALSVLATILFLILSAIQPDFMESVAEASSNPTSPNAKAIVGALLIAILFLPTYLFCALALFAGLGFTISIDGTGLSGYVLDVSQSILSSQTFLPSASISAYESLGWYFELAVLFAVSVVALISGKAASIRLKFSSKSDWDLLRTLAFVGALLLSAVTLSQLSLSWRAQVETSDGDKDQIDSGLATIGISFVSALLVIAIISFAIYLSAGKLSNFTLSAFPRTVKWTTKDQSESVVKRTLPGRVFGALTTLLLVLAVVVPSTIAITERVWATNESPEALGKEISRIIESDDLEKLKKELSKSDRTEWLPDSAMAAAKPTAADAATVSVVNNQGKPWEVGNLDAKVTLSWGQGEAAVSFPFETSYKLNRMFGIFNHPAFSPNLKPISMEIKAGRFLPEEQLSTTKINGESLEIGSYSAIPGVYRITSDGYKLIAATDVTVVTGTASVTVSLGESLAIPAGGEASLEDALAKRKASCEKLSDGKSRCFSQTDAIRSAAVSTGSVPDEYFSIDRSGFALSPIICSSDTVDTLTSASSMTRVVNCQATYKFTEKYHKTEIQKVQVPIYSYSDELECTSYDYYYDYCENYEWVTYKTRVGTETIRREVEGKVIAKVERSANVSISISLSAKLGENGKLTVK